MKVELCKNEMKDINAGSNLRRFRNERCYCQEYISSQLGLSQSTYQRIETGEIKISLERLKKIALILDKPIEAFLKDIILDNYEIEKKVLVNENEWNLMKKVILQQEKRIEELEQKLNYKKD